MTLPTGTRDALGYALAVAVLTTLGVFFRSYVLNWIAGPTIVVLVIAGYDRLTHRRQRGPS